MEGGINQLMEKIIIIVPYFGSLPSNFNMFLRSCGKNENVDFILVTDQDIQSQYLNIEIYRMEFETFKSIIQQSFNFQIALESPYKLCDYKPTYGKVLQKWLQGYDFWGYCDIDMIFGRIDHFVSDEILSECDQIYHHGHFTLYRNNKINNDRFMSDKGLDYRKVFTSNKIYFFDEQIMPEKFDLLRVPRYKGKDFIDINPWRFRLIDVFEKNTRFFKSQTTLFEWDEGELFKWMLDIDGKFVKTEYLYIHFQKREMIDQTNNEDHVLITTKGLLPRQSKIDKQLFLELDENNFFGDIKKRFDKQKFILNRRIKRYILK